MAVRSRFESHASDVLRVLLDATVARMENGRDREDASSMSFVVPGEPVAKARARTFSKARADGTMKTRTTTPTRTRAYEKKVRMLCAVAANKARWTSSKSDRFDVAVDVYRTHEGLGGDVDNVLKSVLDAIHGPGLAMPDDRYVRTVVCRLHHDKANPRIEVTVRKYPKVAA